MTNPNEQDVQFQELLAQARANSREAIGDLLWGCHATLEAAIAATAKNRPWPWKDSPSDMLQEIYVRAVRSFRLFRGTSRGELLAWLKQIRLTTFVDFHRRYAPGGMRDPAYEVALDTSSHDPPAKMKAPAGELSREEKEELFSWLMWQLSAEERRALQLHYLDQYTDKQVAEALGCSPAAAFKRRTRTMLKVKELRQDRHRCEQEV